MVRPQGVRTDRFGDSRSLGDAEDDAAGSVPVQTLPVGPAEDWPVEAFPSGEVQTAGGTRRERDRNDLAALAEHGQGVVAEFGADGSDVGAERLADPQPVQREERDQRVLLCRTQPGGDKQSAQFVAVQRRGVGLVVQPGPADVRGRRVIQEFFLDGVPVEAGDGAQPAGDGGPGLAARFHVTAESLDVGSPRGEQVQPVLGTPGGELAQVEGVGIAGQAAVSGQETSQRLLLTHGEQRISDRH
jgi:hypothetical protein